MDTPAEGLLLLESSLKLIYANTEAIQILAYPDDPHKIRSLDSFLAEKIRSVLLKEPWLPRAGFVKELKSGKRRYVCRTFTLDISAKGQSNRPTLALVMERIPRASLNGSQLAEKFRLTQRERETVEYFMQGLTSKQIAKRMNISPNTVKAFMRFIMVKMGVTNRCGIIGVLFKARP